MAAKFAKFKRDITEVLKQKIEPWQVEVGILQDAPHRVGLDKMKKFAGGTARHVSRIDSGKSISQVSADARKALGINYLTRPFQSRNRRNSDAVRMMIEFYKLVFQEGKSAGKRRYENAVQAVIRNPLTRADYGRNKSSTAKIKGSNRKFIDTGQLFRAIKARVKLVRRRRSV